MSTPATSADARTTQAELRAARAENRLREERIRAHRLAAVEARAERRRQLTESYALDWVTPYAELLDLTRSNGDPVFAGAATYWQRRGGTNWPIYRTEQDLALLRAPARMLLATNGYAQGLVEGLTSYALGAGCTYRASKVRDTDDTPREILDACQRVIDDFLERNQWFGGEQPGLEEELFGRSIEDGEFFLINYPRADGCTLVRTVEPEQVTQPPGSDPREYLLGVRTPAHDVQDPRSYYVQFGEAPTDGEEFDADYVTHLRRNVRRGMKRGITDFAFDTYDALYLGSRLRTNLGDTAAQQAAIVAVRQHNSGTKQDIEAFVEAGADFTQSDPISGRQVQQTRHRRGSWEEVPDGMNYVPGPIASSSPIHIQVLDACLRGAGQKWQAPPWLMSGDLNAMNYATSLTAESPFVRTILRRQRGYCEAFKRPVWFALRHYARTHGLCAAGRVWTWEEIEARVKLSVTAPSPETRNRLEEATRAQTEITLGVQSRQKYMQEQGRDPDQIEADNQEWQDKFGSPGQQLPTDPFGGGGADVRTGNGDGTGLPLPESDVRASALGRALLESGFTGEITDAAGRHRKYVDGQQVAAGEGSAAATDAGGGAKPDAGAARPWPDHPAAGKVQNAIADSNVSAEQKAAYSEAMAGVMSRLPGRALDRIGAHLSGSQFYESSQALGVAVFSKAMEQAPSEQRAQMQLTLDRIKGGEISIGGCYESGAGAKVLHLDGGMQIRGGKGAHGTASQSAAEVYAHELGHAIDGPDHQISNHPKWQEAWAAEIGPAAGAGANARLSGYATKDTHEGFAEFARLVYGGTVPLDRVENEFPRCSALIKAAKLWPS